MRSNNFSSIKMCKQRKSSSKAPAAAGVNNAPTKLNSSAGSLRKTSEFERISKELSSMLGKMINERHGIF
jgi:hypothetical protein